MSAAVVYTLTIVLLLCVAEYELLCGNPAPGFIIDIHTGKPIGKKYISVRRIYKAMLVVTWCVN